MAEVFLIRNHFDHRNRELQSLDIFLLELEETVSALLHIL
jgi:hypothetical protein